MILEEFINLRSLIVIENVNLNQIILPLFLENLTEINISNNSLKSLDFLFISDYPNLEKIASVGNDHQGYDIVSFNKFKNLKSITISNANFFGTLES
jgi:hypothetical protein